MLARAAFEPCTVCVCRERNATLTGIYLANNDLEGDLSPLAGVALMRVNVHNNEKLCGMVPGSVRWAKGYNPFGTNLGKPCSAAIQDDVSAIASQQATEDATGAQVGGDAAAGR